MRKFFGVVALFFAFFIVMLLFLGALQNLSLIDLNMQEFIIISVLAAIFIDIAFYFDNIISE
ncbi:hypothetical protein [Sulfurimonas sp. C5]|uniref:hypothetical protein n=1 Tax=Sulfurimonas sp. C5 TaxID=3036947 RepID=UPI0024578904|nr:hypothetical protein [Sulfurimonas sp. C5]MDH4943980.1 hypothetical protein [Sulfurimonas sp. C5]